MAYTSSDECKIGHHWYSIDFFTHCDMLNLDKMYSV